MALLQPRSEPNLSQESSPRLSLTLLRSAALLLGVSSNLSRYLGSLSINTFIGFIPGIGFLPSSPDMGLIDIIPGLSNIPALGLGGGKYRLFEVKIEGDLYDPASVKSFRWIDPKSLKGKMLEQK